MEREHENGSSQASAASPRTRNAAYTREYLQSIAQLGGDEQGRRATWDYMLSSTALFDGIVVYSSYLPRLFDAATYERFKSIAETTYRIVTKVMEEYLANPGYRPVFGFDERMNDLILLPRDYDALLPFARFDLFLDEDTLDATFCEFNADGSSGMNENREVTLSIQGSTPFKEFAARHAVRDCNAELFEGWVSEFLRIYDTYAFKVERPRVAIVDFLEVAVVEEFKVYARLFEERGIGFSVYDVRDLEFDGTHLRGHKALVGEDDAPIDAIWRRCVASDVVAHWQESQPLVEAVRARKVALIGSFAGQIVHDKRIFQALFHPQTKRLLTAEENAFVAATVPFTSVLDAQLVDLDEIKAHPAQWIIKPPDAYGSRNVYAGRDFSAGEWAHIIDERANGASGAPFLVQRFCTPFKTEAMPFYDKEADFTAKPSLFNNLSGLYVYNGRFTGVFSRLGPNSIILGRLGGVTAASLWVDVDAEDMGDARKGGALEALPAESELDGAVGARADEGSGNAE